MADKFTEIHNYIQKEVPKSREKLQKALKEKKLFVFLLTKKMVGKSVYSQYLKEFFPGQFVNLSFGQAVRDLQKNLEENPQQVKEKWGLDVVKDLKESSVKKLLPLSTVSKIFDHLIKQSPQNKSVLFDGIPRKTEQVSLTLKKARELRNQDYQVLFLEIDLADGILDQRLQSRRVCPQCNFTGNILTPSIDTFGYDEENNEFFLLCPHCNIKLKRKKGDKPSPAIYKRRRNFEKVARRLKEESQDIPYLYLRSDIPKDKFKKEPEEINQIVEFYREGKTILTRQKAQTAEFKGKTVYSLAPRAGLALIIKKITTALY